VFTTIDPGITVNRFSQDMSLVDMELPLAFANTIICKLSHHGEKSWAKLKLLAFMTCVGQMLVIAVSSRYLGAAVPFVVAVCIVTQRLYIRTSRQLRFMDLEAKGPLYTQFIETLNGLASIRAFDIQDNFREEMYTILDASQKPFYLLFCAQRWLGLVLNLTNMALALILIGVASVTRNKTQGGFLGVALINLMTFGYSLSDLINTWATLETSLAAVERVRYFSEETPAESTQSPEEIPPQWPLNGSIEIKDLTVNYE